MVKLINPEELSPPIGFSHVAEAGGLVWLGGQIGSDSNGRVVDPGDIVAQFRRAIQNVAAALSSVRCEPQCAVKLTYYVTDADAYRRSLKQIGEAYREVFGKHYPASLLLEVKGLFDPEAMVEIECIAVREPE
jgi:enamine deaminase RidA (YjgF/YER057c/UK114 family)